MPDARLLPPRACAAALACLRRAHASRPHAHARAGRPHAPVSPAAASWTGSACGRAARGSGLRTRAAPDLDFGALPAEEPLDRQLAEVVYALLAAQAARVPPAAVLPKFHDTLTPRAYTSILVALGRKEAWDSAAAVAAWARQQGTALPADAYVRVALRRAQEGHWDRALEAFGWMKDLGCEPSGEAVEALAQLAAAGAPHFVHREQLREVVSWVRASDAGRALWRVYAPDAAPVDSADGPAWRSQGLVVEDGGVLNAPLHELRTALSELGGAPSQGTTESAPRAATAPRSPPATTAVPAQADADARSPATGLSDIDALLRSKRRK